MKKFKIIVLLALLGLILSNCGASNTKTVKDGSSFENAIKVKSVAEEYEIIRKVCSNCKMKSQSLSSKGKKYYDVLRLENDKGEEVKYYFDINSFYGKW